MCPTCDAVRAAHHVGMGHSVACRERFRGVFDATGDSCVERAHARRGAGGVPPLPQDDADVPEPHAHEALALERPAPDPDAIDADSHRLRVHATAAPRVTWADLVDSDEECARARLWRSGRARCWGTSRMS